MGGYTLSEKKTFDTCWVEPPCRHAKPIWSQASAENDLMSSPKFLCLYAISKRTLNSLSLLKEFKRFVLSPSPLKTQLTCAVHGTAVSLHAVGEEKTTISRAYPPPPPPFGSGIGAEFFKFHIKLELVLYQSSCEHDESKKSRHHSKVVDCEPASDQIQCASQIAFRFLFPQLHISVY